MTIPALEDIINNVLPANVGILVAGSQRNNNSFSVTSDIDIVALDPFFSVVYSLAVTHEGYKIDITVVPFSDMENTLLNESMDPKGGLLHMLNTGVVLKDKLNLYGILQQKAGALLDRIGGKTFPLYKQKKEELGRFVKYFAKSLPPQQKSVIACEAVSIISTMESIKASNWVSKKHKLSLFNAESENVICKELITAFNEATRNDNHQPLANLATYYCLAADNLPVFTISENVRLVIDLDYPRSSLNHFVENLLPAIRQVELLDRSLACFYLSPRQYQKTYKHNLSMSFVISGHADAAAKLQALNTVFAKELTEGMRHLLIYQNNDIYNNKAFSLLEKLRKALNQFIADEINLENYGSIKTVHHVIFLGAYISNSLRLSPTDIGKGNAFLGQRSILTSEEQRQLNNFDQLKRQQGAKAAIANNFFKEHHTSIINCCNGGVLQSLQYPLNSEDSYSGIIKTLNELLDHKDLLKNPCTNLTYLALKTANCVNTDDLLLYVLLMEEIMQYLSVVEGNKFFSLFSFSKAILELKGN